MSEHIKLRDLYQVQATVNYRKPNGWTEVAQVPTFFLYVETQGIVNDKQAEKIAKRVIDPCGLLEVHAIVGRCD